MSAPPDLTRWNRAGLTRFRYIDGNAVSFLETLRTELAARFGDPPIVETPAQRDARILRQYSELRDDWSWDILRAFARASYVLGEYVDAYANEGYLRTATQWDSVRKLVAMLDVHPAPPASASTPLVIEAKGEAGKLAAGFGVRYTPKDGTPPVVFETIEEIVVDPLLNALHLEDWNHSPEPLIDLPPERPAPPVGNRPAQAIEGVGPWYQTHILNPHAPVSSGLFAIKDFRNFNPAGVAHRHVLRLWEAKSKAELLLDFPWTASELAALANQRMSDVRAMTASAIAAATGLDLTRAEAFLEDLRNAEMALDEPVFTAARLSELLSTGAPPPDPPPLWQAPEKSGISAGELALVVRSLPSSEEGAVVRIARLEAATREILLEQVGHQPAWETWTRGVSSLLAKPKVIAVAQVAGSAGAVTFTSAHSLSAGDRVAWQAGSSWAFAQVQRADELAVVIAGSAQPAAGAEIFRAVQNSQLTLPLNYRAAATLSGSQTQLVAAGDRTEVKDSNNVVRYYTVSRAGATSIVYVPDGAQAAGHVDSVAPVGGDGKFRFGGKPGKLESGQWVVGDDGTRFLALRIASIESLEDHFVVTFESVAQPVPAVSGQAAVIVSGVGNITANVLNQHGVHTVGQLAAVNLAAGIHPLGSVELLELRAKAQVVTHFAYSEHDLEPLLDSTLPSLLAMTKYTLGDALGKPSAWAADLLDELRLLQALIDEPSLATLRVRDLLPIGPPQPVAGYTLTHLTRIYGVFEHTIRPRDWNVNDTPVTNGHLKLELVPPALLARGRRLILERAGFAREATVVNVDAAARTLDVAPAPIADEGFTIGNLIVHANVPRAGHGEGKPAKVLGSGDATRRSQTFILKEKDVSFVADPTQPAGVAAAVQVSVAGQVWLQVATLRDSRPTDSHYEVQLTEDRYLAVTFGDGLRGRRLPTGTNNVRVAFRIGNGLAGNVRAGSLVKAARPNPRVAAVSQPLPATGGNDREDIDSMKTQAPRSVLTLERAVSLSDFEVLAARQSSVWQARAFALPTGGGRHASVEVVVVPAGGGPLGSLASDLATFLRTNALPGVDLRISAYVSKPFDLQVDVEVKSAEFDPDEVRKNVEAALFDAFSLRRRALGASLFVSEVYAIVENIKGVESSKADVGFGSFSNERVLSAAPREVIFLDPANSRVSVTAREFQL